MNLFFLSRSAAVCRDSLGYANTDFGRTMILHATGGIRVVRWLGGKESRASPILKPTAMVCQRSPANGSRCARHTSDSQAKTVDVLQPHHVARVRYMAEFRFALRLHRGSSAN